MSHEDKLCYAATDYAAREYSPDPNGELTDNEKEGSQLRMSSSRFAAPMSSDKPVGGGAAYDGR